MDGSGTVPHAIMMVEDNARTMRSEKQKLLDDILDLLADLGGKTKRLASLSCDDGITDLENQRALRWIDANLEDMAATAVGVAMSYANWDLPDASHQLEREVR